MDLNKAKVLGIIPAKGKSTRLPRKNVMEFCGKPLIAWTIEAALDSGVIDDLVVSTEDHEIAQVAESWGAEVPFIRDGALSVDPAGVEAVSLDCIAKLANKGRFYDEVIILLPTSPLRTASDIVNAKRLFDKENASSLMSVCLYEHSPFSAYESLDSKHLTPLFPELNRKKSQELPPAYRCNGAIHILKIPFFLEKESYTCAPLIKFEMKHSHSIDIDTIDDLIFGEFLYGKHHGDLDG